MRIGLGCMRLSTDPDRDEERALATLHAALDAGITTLDTARAYGWDEADLSHNERLIARALAARPDAPRPRVITKCGMRRDDGAWIPDGRARRILSDARASVKALGRPLDLLLLHAPDPRTSLATAARALARVHTDGLALRIGVSNVSRKQIEEVAALAPIHAVEMALGAHDDLAVRSGVIAYALEHGLEILAHAPLGGPERATRLVRDRALSELRSTHAAKPTAAELVLAYLLAVHPAFVPIVGARQPATIASLLRAESLLLSEEQLLLLDARFPVLGALRRPAPRVTGGAEVVLMMGIPGAGKSRSAESYVARGYQRLNRDTLGGTLRGIVRLLDDRLRDGATRLVLDNTYVTRATRSDVLRAAHARGATVRCIYFATPAHEAAHNIVMRMIDRFGHVLEPKEIAAFGRSEPTALTPTALLRMVRDLEPPSADEGFATIETVSFVRDPSAPELPRAVAVALGAVDDDARATLLTRLAEEPAGVACILVAWRPGSDAMVCERIHAFAAAVANTTGRLVEAAICSHPAGPPVCWCRPPLPGAWLAFMRRHGVVVRD